MIVTIHQPEHLPWLGFFDKIRQADVFIVLDHVQYRKRYFQNRNRIRTASGEQWLTVPVEVKGKYDQTIREVRVDGAGDPQWATRCWKSLLQNYRKAPGFDAHAGFFSGLYERKWDRLQDLNEAVIEYLMSVLDLRARLVRSSTLYPQGQKGDLMLDLCRKVGASAYLSGISGKEYLDPAQFQKAGIEVRFQEFHHPIYDQRYEPFLPCMSTIDLLFNHGLKSRDILRGVGVRTLDHVFT